MRIRVLACTATAVLTAAALAGCGSLGSTVNTTAANNGTTHAPGNGAPAAAAKPASLGDTIDVTDMNGVKLAVTLVKVDAKTRATDDFSTPPSGDSYYAAQVQIKDVGTSAWSDAPGNCLKVADAKGQQFQTDILQSISSGPLMQDTVNLAAGGTALGWVVFDVPAGDKVTQVQFTTDSGMGSDTAQWSVQ